MAMAWPSSMPSSEVSLAILLFRCGSLASRTKASLQSCQLSPPSLVRITPPTSNAAKIVPGLLRMLRHAHHAAGERHHAARRHLRIGQPPPRLAAVLAAVHCGGRAAGIDQLRIRRHPPGTTRSPYSCRESSRGRTSCPGRCCDRPRHACRRTRGSDRSDARRPHCWRVADHVLPRAVRPRGETRRRRRARWRCGRRCRPRWHRHWLVAMVCSSWGFSPAGRLRQNRQG